MHSGHSGAPVLSRVVPSPVADATVPQDLCDRHEKGVLHKQQRALHRYGLMRRQMLSAAAQSREPHAVDRLESHILEVAAGAGGVLPPLPLLGSWVPGSVSQQENAIQTMELRNHFSLYCLHQETQLVHAYLPLTSHILGAFVNSQIQGHEEVGSRLPGTGREWVGMSPWAYWLGDRTE